MNVLNKYKDITMKITAVSDLHGNLINIELCDILLICGDISPLDIQKDYIQMTKWFFNEFQKWIMNLPCDRVILTPGNHDFWFEKMITQPQTYLFDKLTILINGEVNIYSGIDDKYYKIFGTPYCKDFGRWAYMPGNDKLPELYDKIPEYVDILICHDSPLIGYVGNIMEKADETYPNGIPAGNQYLAGAVFDKRPKYVLSGHIHSGDHTLKEYVGVKLANVSILDESYNIAYKPLTIEI